MGFTLTDNTAAVFQGLVVGNEAGLHVVAELVAEQAKSNIEKDLNTTGEATGALAADVHIEYTGKGFDLAAKVGVSLVYGRIHEYGGVIAAKNGPYLVFQTPDGEWHSVPTVKIPARPWLRPAALMSRPKMASAYAGGMKA